MSYPFTEACTRKHGINTASVLVLLCKYYRCQWLILLIFQSLAWRERKYWENLINCLNKPSTFVISKNAATVELLACNFKFEHNSLPHEG
jgi:hypothetical protein